MSQSHRSVYQSDPLAPRRLIATHHAEVLTMGAIEATYDIATLVHGVAVGVILMNWRTTEAYLHLLSLLHGTPSAHLALTPEPRLWYRGAAITVIRDMPHNQVIFAKWSEPDAMLLQWGTLHEAAHPDYRMAQLAMHQEREAARARNQG